MSKETYQLIVGLIIFLFGPMAVAGVIALLLINPITALIVAVPVFWGIVYFIISGGLMRGGKTDSTGGPTNLMDK